MTNETDNAPNKKIKHKKIRRLEYRPISQPLGVALSSKKNIVPTPEGTSFDPLGLCQNLDTVHSNIKFISNGGGVLRNVHVQLLYWGTFWATSITEPASDISDSVRDMLSGCYMTYLAQYGVGRGSLLEPLHETDSDPPNDNHFDNMGNLIGSGFTLEDVGNFIRDKLDSGWLPTPDSNPPIFYCIIMPPSATFFDVRHPPNTNGVVGQNSRINWIDATDPSIGGTTHFAWIGNDGTADYVTQILSHELVETCTDPDRNGVRLDGCLGSSCQIGDGPCESICDRVNGVKVQGYWSEADKMCIAPNWYIC